MCNKWHYLIYYLNVQDPLNYELSLVRPNLIMDLTLKENQVKIQSHSFPRINLRMNDLKMDPKDHFVLKRKKAKIRRIHFPTSLHTGVEIWRIMSTRPAHIFPVRAFKLAHSGHSSFDLGLRITFFFKLTLIKPKTWVIILSLHSLCLSPQAQELLAQVKFLSSLRTIAFECEFGKVDPRWGIFWKPLRFFLNELLYHWCMPLPAQFDCKKLSWSTCDGSN